MEIMIADDHKLFRSGLKLMCEEMLDVTVIAEADNGYELVGLVQEHKPDIILMDIEMPVMGGIEATKYLKSKYPDIKIVILSMHENEQFTNQLLDLGINGYLSKNSDFEKMEYTINAVKNNHYFFSGKVNNIIKKKLLGTIREFKSTTNYKLTSRESEVIQLICKEFSNVEIASKLHLSPRTIETYKMNIKEKIGAKNTAGMVCSAIQHGLVDLAI